jgi:hypothetical protein
LATLLRGGSVAEMRRAKIFCGEAELSSLPRQEGNSVMRGIRIVTITTASCAWTTAARILPFDETNARCAPQLQLRRPTPYLRNALVG